MPPIPEGTLLAIERHFHALIRERAGQLIDEHGVQLPELASLIASGKGEGFLSIPGMYGGFSYRLEGDGEQAKLVSESWSRVVGGSGQRHEITANGAKLVAKGFV